MIVMLNFNPRAGDTETGGSLGLTGCQCGQNCELHIQGYTLSQQIGGEWLRKIPNIDLWPLNAYRHMWMHTRTHVQTHTQTRAWLYMHQALGTIAALRFKLLLLLQVSSESSPVCRGEDQDMVGDVSSTSIPAGQQKRPIMQSVFETSPPSASRSVV